MTDEDYQAELAKRKQKTNPAQSQTTRLVENACRDEAPRPKDGGRHSACGRQSRRKRSCRSSQSATSGKA